MPVTPRDLNLRDTGIHPSLIHRDLNNCGTDAGLDSSAVGHR